MNRARSRMVGPALWGMAPLVAVASLTLAGCGPSHPLLPLSVGKTWTYHARYGLGDERVEKISVVRELAVANGRGYELAGPLGVSRLGWHGRTLFADESANAFFDPSLPLLTEDGRAPKPPWSGQITVNGRSYPATANLTESEKPTKLSIAGQEYSARMVQLTIHSPDRPEIELDSWYSPGVGLVRQEQRTRDDLVIRLELVTAP